MVTRPSTTMSRSGQTLSSSKISESQAPAEHRRTFIDPEIAEDRAIKEGFELAKQALARQKELGLSEEEMLRWIRRGGK